MRRTVPVVAACVLAACSFTTDFDRYDSAYGGGDGGSGADASGVGEGGDAAPAAGHTCAEADGRRFFCASFDAMLVEGGWDKTIVGSATVTGMLDGARAFSAPSAARFSVSGGPSGRYHILFGRPRPLAPVNELFARVYYPSGTQGTTTLLSLSAPDGHDQVALDVTPTGAVLAQRDDAIANPVNVRTPFPRDRFVYVVLRRDDATRTATVAIDGVQDPAVLKLQGTLPSATFLEARAGLVYSIETTSRVELWVDDVGVRRGE